MTSPVAAPKPKRMPLWDNARFATIALVVLGHAILKLTAESDSAYVLYLLIYSFHVPVFVLVSGYFAKSTPAGVPQLRGLITNLALPYLIFEVIWTVIRGLVTGDYWFDLASPSWTLWFLLALIAWRVILPYLALMKYPLLISIAASLLAGAIPAITSEFAISRMLGLLPFFVLGWKLRNSTLPAWWDEQRGNIVVVIRSVAAVLFIALIVLFAVTSDWWRTAGIGKFFYYDDAYEVLGYGYFEGAGIRLAALVVSSILSLAFISLIPRRTTPFSALGQATLYVYLLHTFALYPFRESGILGGEQAFWVLPAMVVFALGLTYFLAQPFVTRVFRPLVEPTANWLFVKSPK